MSHSSQGSAAPPQVPQGRSWMRWIVPKFPRTGRGWLKWIGLRFFLAPLVVCAVFAFLQRSLIYVPRREAEIRVEQSGLPAGQVHDVAFVTYDGLRMHGWHVLPEGNFAADQSECDRLLEKPGPVVLYFHGNAGNRRTRGSDCRDFTWLGAHVFLYDYRGYGENPGSPNEADLVRDARSQWDELVRERGVAPDRIVIYGESLGGAVATRLASDLCKDGIHPGGLLLRGTFSSLTDVGAYHYPWLPVRWLLLDRYDSTEHIAAVTCPIVCIHGELDEIVPLEFGRRLFEAAADESDDGIAKRWVELAGRGHNDISVSEFASPISTLFDQLGTAGEQVAATKTDDTGAPAEAELVPQSSSVE